MSIRPQARCIDSAVESGGDLKLHIHVPFGVIQIVVVKMDGSVSLGRSFEAGLSPGPAVPCDTAHRHVNRGPVQALARLVNHLSRRDVGGEVPGSDRTQIIHPPGIKCGGRQLVGAKSGREDPGAVDLPIELGADLLLPLSPRLPDRAHQKRDGIHPRFSSLDGPGNNHLTASQRPVAEGFLIEGDAAFRRLENGGHPGPAPGLQRACRRHLVDLPCRVTNPEGQMALAIDEQPPARAGVGRPLGDDSLDSLPRSRRIDPCLQCEAAGKVKQRTVWNDDIGTRVKFLPAAGIKAIDSSFDLLLLEARSPGIGVSVNQTNDVQPVGGFPGTHHEADRFARLNAQEVRISRQSVSFPDRVLRGHRPKKQREGENENEVSRTECG